MKRRRFLYSVAGLTVRLLLPGPLVRASEQPPRGEGGLFLPPVNDATAGASKTIYLTFDDGYIGLAEKVAALNSLGVLGSFFLTGQAIDNHPGAVQDLVNAGHVLGNHTYDHSDLTRLSYGTIQSQLQRCERAAQRTVGVSTLPHMRPPYGSVSSTVRSAARELGYDTILWNWDTRDWAGTSAAYIEHNIGSGIVLMHTQGRNTVAALSDLIPDLAAQGYIFNVL